MSEKYSMSAMETFRRCPRKYYYRYLKGLETPQTANMTFGSRFHDEVARWYAKDPTPKLTTLSDEDEAKLQDVLAYYWEHVGSKDAFDEILSIEKVEELPFEDTTFRFKFDLVVRTKDRLWVIDHKTVGKINQSLAFLPLDFQVGSYLWAAQRLYGEGVGLIYNLVRREVPPGYGSRPTTTKSGAQSRASTNPSDYLHRAYIVPSPHEIREFEVEMQRTLSALRASTFQRSPVRDGGMACEFCPYYSVCCAELRGVKVDDKALSMLYSQRKEENENTAIGL